VLVNFSDRGWPGYRVPLPVEGEYEVLVDGDATEFGGGGRTRVHGPADRTPHRGRPASLTVDLPPLTAVLLVRRTG
jgi:1,4-alpha-glucan branching enzyme